MQVLPISHVPSLSWQRERREWMPGVKIKGKHQIVGRILGQNREVYLGTWLVHFKSVSHTYMSRKTCQVYKCHNCKHWNDLDKLCQVFQLFFSLLSLLQVSIVVSCQTYRYSLLHGLRFMKWNATMHSIRK